MLQRVEVVLDGALREPALRGHRAAGHRQRERGAAALGADGHVLTVAEQLLGLVEARRRAVDRLERAVRLGEAGEDVGHELGGVQAAELERRFAQADRQQVLVATGAHLGHVRQREHVVVGPVETLVGRERGLVGDQRTIGVAERVVDDRDGVQQVALVDPMVGEAVQLERLQRRLERLAEVAGVVVHEADQVQCPHLDHRGAHLAGQFTGIEGDREGIVGLAGGVGDRGQAVQRLGFAGAVVERSGQHTGLLGHRTGGDDVGALAGARIVEQFADRLGHARALDERRRPDCHRHLLTTFGSRQLAHGTSHTTLGSRHSTRGRTHARLQASDLRRVMHGSRSVLFQP